MSRNGKKKEFRCFWKIGGNNSFTRKNLSRCIFVNRILILRQRYGHSLIKILLLSFFYFQGQTVVVPTSAAANGQTSWILETTGNPTSPNSSVSRNSMWHEIGCASEPALAPGVHHQAEIGVQPPAAMGDSTKQSSRNAEDEACARELLVLGSNRTTNDSNSSSRKLSAKLSNRIISKAKKVCLFFFQTKTLYIFKAICLCST